MNGQGRRRPSSRFQTLAQKANLRPDTWNLNTDANAPASLPFRNIPPLSYENGRLLPPTAPLPPPLPLSQPSYRFAPQAVAQLLLSPCALPANGRMPSACRRAECDPGS